jgi:glutamate formiminotransferase
MSKLVEFVPNISEGRILSNIEYIANSIRTCEGVQLLNVSSDHDHNRTVFTIVGDLESIPLCTEKLYEAAISKIALRKHFGVHPRIGAVDVAPFIPLGETSMDECVALSEIIGAHIAEQFDLPVFLYANSATQPNRKKLADIRREGFEGLSKKLALPEWKPDFGTTIPHPTAGATVIGARFFQPQNGSRNCPKC